MMVGHIDGNRRPLCRPGRAALQEAFYNGWTRNHNLLFIAIVFPDGTFLIRGPEAGRHNDLYILNSSGLLADLPRLLGHYAVGGDGIFPFTPNIRGSTLYASSALPAGDARRFNSSRVTVEWLFSQITSQFQLSRLLGFLFSSISSLLLWGVSGEVGSGDLCISHTTPLETGCALDDMWLCVFCE
jgi:hypothetical protein